MGTRNKILIVEDELSVSYAETAVLEKNGYDVIHAEDGKTAEQMISSHCPDLIVLDLGLPIVDGMTVLRNLRKWSATPVVVVSARDEESDKVAVLEAGADDFLSKPFGPSELAARIKVALRHAATAGTANVSGSRITIGDLVIDFDKHRVFLGGNDVGLTQNEFRLVSLLAKNAGRVLAYKDIIKDIWGPNATADNQILRVNIANIRRKIERNPADPRYIFTEMGVGYRMAEE